jgi:8-hydroxy-5-deazaflavin:NADPH oxidoreductase
MNVGIIGSGEVAQSLAKGFIDRGDAIALGTRDTAKLKDFVAAHPGSRASSNAEAAAFGELIVVATSGDATIAVLKGIDPAAFSKKVVIDATNFIAEEDGGFRLQTASNDSMGERVQGALPQAHVVKAFNTVAAADMVRPKYSGGPPTMFIAGDDAGAKTTVSGILRNFGYDVADIGGITSARYLEAMCMAWLLYGQVNGTWHHAFKLLT